MPTPKDIPAGPERSGRVLSRRSFLKRLGLGLTAVALKPGIDAIAGLGPALQAAPAPLTVEASRAAAAPSVSSVEPIRQLRGETVRNFIVDPETISSVARELEGKARNIKVNSPRPTAGWSQERRNEWLNDIGTMLRVEVQTAGAIARLGDPELIEMYRAYADALSIPAGSPIGEKAILTRMLAARGDETAALVDHYGTPGAYWRPSDQDNVIFAYTSAATALNGEEVRGDRIGAIVDFIHAYSVINAEKELSLRFRRSGRTPREIADQDLKDPANIIVPTAQAIEIEVDIYQRNRERFSAVGIDGGTEQLDKKVEEWQAAREIPDPLERQDQKLKLTNKYNFGGAVSDEDLARLTT